MIQTSDLKVGYERNIVIDKLSLKIEEGELVSIIGPNGSGKSTLLKSIARFINKESGEILLLNKTLGSMRNGDIAKTLSVVLQHNSSPGDITVKELVYYGRSPHKKWYECRNRYDEEIVEWAIINTGMSKFHDRKVMSLSGGERQRAWIAMSLAQKTDILFLDEPTTYLDMCYQLELMQLIEDINRKFNMTIVMVLHDLNQAIRHSNRIILMKDGKIIVDGCPDEIITEEIIYDVYNVKCSIGKCPVVNKKYIYPIGVCS